MRPHLTLVGLYSERLHAALLAEPVLITADIYTHPVCAGLAHETIAKLIEVLQHDGRITENTCGRLVVAPLTDAAA